MVWAESDAMTTEQYPTCQAEHHAMVQMRMEREGSSAMRRARTDLKRWVWPATGGESWHSAFTGTDALITEQHPGGKGGKQPRSAEGRCGLHGHEPRPNRPNAGPTAGSGQSVLQSVWIDIEALNTEQNTSGQKSRGGVPVCFTYKHVLATIAEQKEGVGCSATSRARIDLTQCAIRPAEKLVWAESEAMGTEQYSICRAEHRAMIQMRMECEGSTAMSRARTELK
jgi:hypothetical protein